MIDEIRGIEKARITEWYSHLHFAVIYMIKWITILFPEEEVLDSRMILDIDDVYHALRDRKNKINVKNVLGGIVNIMVLLLIYRVQR